MQEIIAKRIIDIAETGERDPDKMCERVLLTFGLSAKVTRRKLSAKARHFRRPCGCLRHRFGLSGFVGAVSFPPTIIR